MIGVEIIVALNRSTESNILNTPCEDVEDTHGKVDVVFFIVEAVIIVSQVVEELAGVGVDQRRQGLGGRHPLLHQLLALGQLQGTHSQNSYDHQLECCQHLLL